MTARIIDVAATLGATPERIRRLDEPEELLAFMDRAGLSDAVASHALAELDPARGNALMDEIGAKYARLHVCHYVDAPNGAEEAEKRLRAAKPAAVKLMPEKQRLPLTPFYCGELFEALDQMHMPVLLPEGQFQYRDLPDMAQTFPNVRFVLLRQGFCHARTTFPLLKKTRNVYFDTSTMLDAGLIDELVNTFGAQRLLFSSGLPAFEPSGALALVLYARIRDEDKEGILSANWLRLEDEITWKR